MIKEKEVRICSMNGVKYGLIPTPEFALSKIHGDRSKAKDKKAMKGFLRLKDEQVKIEKEVRNTGKSSYNRIRFGGYKIPV